VYKYLYILAIICFWSCGSSGEDDDYTAIDDGTLDQIENPVNIALDLNVPGNFPNPAYDLASNPITEKGFELGKKLFYEGRLSADGVISCGFCHIQDFGFTHHTHITSHGINGQIGTRNAQPLANLAFMNTFNWDGAATHLDSQPIIPITAHDEMGETIGNVLEKLRDDPNYPAMFEAAYGTSEVTAERMLKSLSQFMLLMISGNSKFDKYQRAESITFTDDEVEGMAIFEAKCASCHSGTLQTDQSFRNNGLPTDPAFNDIGRERVTGLSSDNRKFRVPSLRNIEVTFPYMHDGRLNTLEKVLDHYTSGMVDSPTLDEQFRQSDGTLGIPLSDLEKQQLIAFLKTLTDNDFIADQRFSEF